MSKHPHDDAELDIGALLERVEVLEAKVINRDRLTDGVARLTDETAGLNAVLAKVDDQQQRLSRLGRQLSNVEGKSATKDEVEEKVKETVRARRRELFRVILPIVASVATVLFLLLFSISQSAHDACEQRQASSIAVIDTLQSFQDPLRPNPNIAEGVERITATLGETCDEQYPLHLPR